MESQVKEGVPEARTEHVNHEELLSESLLTNAKLAKAMELLVEFNLTTNEKIDITKKIDCSNSLDELAGTIKLLRKDLSKSFIDEATGEKWSPEFISEIMAHYETGLGFNPLEKIKENVKMLENFVSMLLDGKEEITEDIKKAYRDNIDSINETFDKMHS